jgi:hypothetical protein
MVRSDPWLSPLNRARLAFELGWPGGEPESMNQRNLDSRVHGNDDSRSRIGGKQNVDKVGVAGGYFNQFGFDWWSRPKR